MPQGRKEEGGISSLRSSHSGGSLSLLIHQCGGCNVFHCDSHRFEQRDFIGSTTTFHGSGNHFADLSHDFTRGPDVPGLVPRRLARLHVYPGPCHEIVATTTRSAPCTALSGVAMACTPWCWANAPALRGLQTRTSRNGRTSRSASRWLRA